MGMEDETREFTPQNLRTKVIDNWAEINDLIKSYTKDQLEQEELINYARKRWH